MKNHTNRAITGLDVRSTARKDGKRLVTPAWNEKLRIHADMMLKSRIRGPTTKLFDKVNAVRQLQ